MAATHETTTRHDPQVDGPAGRAGDMSWLVACMSRMEKEVARGQAADRSRAWVAATAAVLGFVATTLVWRLGHKVAVIDTAVHRVAAVLERTTAGTEAGLRRIDGTLTAQATAVGDLTATIAGIEALARQTQATLAAVETQARHNAEATGLCGRQLVALALDVARFRHETDSRLAKHHDAMLTGRAEIVRAVEASIAEVEAAVIRQADDLRARQEGMNAASVQLRTKQQRMLGEATEAIATQLDGLRQIVDALRDETLTGVEQPVSQPVAGDEPAAAASPPETAGQPAETAGEQPVAEVAAEPRAAVAE
jgi:hypothetical protein